ncbi:MAG: c-type cytochrome domain-containing protein, partial [Planctomycetota bacterium]|nr:c-type cytochrome domain-containing protein [Planctomycetota bacterium]
MSNVKLSIRCLLFATLLLAASRASAAEFDKKGLDYFESKIRPVLVKNCYQCHSAKAASEGKLKGKLQLDTREGARRGGETGPAVVPGKP